MLGIVQFRFEKMVNMVMYNTFKYFGKIVKNSNGPIIPNRGKYPFFLKQGQ
jgi:hypothetical protein